MKRLLDALTSVRNHTDFIPKIGIVLGSGLGNFANKIKVETTIPYQQIEGFPLSTVDGHKGQFVFGYIESTPVVLMQGRVHYYEGYTMEEVVLPIRLMKLLGITTLYLTNAAGGCNPHFQAGDLMLITDQISSMVPSPLIGKNKEDLGARFPDMSNIYHKELQHIISKTAVEHNISLKEGVYLQFSGPQYESPAEIRMARLLGADAVGMSTACEAIAANHMGLQICGISCITNLAAGISTTPLNHEDVKNTADRVAKNFQTLLYHSIKNMEQVMI